ncbi:archease [Geobacter grbiciae]|uniref:archease n=1 Tax=Geobacter grbiciae TaxID=155042 RepID=UPI001C02CEEC|nr:archease [Geobacter grbiciae]MBT1075884.1 archease [Geobacter grbiciae]
MPYRYLPDIATADIAFEATGATREEMFTAAADALTNVMVEDLATIQPRQELEIILENADLDLLLFDFLQEIIYYKDARRLLLRPSSLTIADSDAILKLHAVVRGEEIDLNRHPMVVDVKAVTLHRFAVELRDGTWRATVVLDI